jgi:hypothetical protein
MLNNFNVKALIIKKKKTIIPKKKNVINIMAVVL